MNKQDIEDEAIKYCSHIDFSNDKSLNEKGRMKVSEWCKQYFIAGAEWMQEQLRLSVVSCSVCGGQDILHEQKEGRGLPPKDWVRKMGDNRRISWRGTWDVWTCKSCGETWRKLR